MQRLSCFAVFIALCGPLQADEITDALAAAQAAYSANDLQGAGEQMAIAQKGVRTKQNAMLEAFLPQAPTGFTREVVADFATGFGMFGGGSGAEARYTNAEGSFTIDLIADNEMVASMVGMFADEATIAMLGTPVKVGDVSVIQQDQNLTAIVGNRVMLTATGMDTSLMLPAVQTIDFAGLAAFDK